MAKSLSTLTLILAVIAVTAPAHAYVGPGAGVSLLGAAFGLIAAIGLALGVVVFWPLRRFLKSRKRRAVAEGTEANTASAEAD